MIKQELNKTITAVAVVGIFAWFVFEVFFFLFLQTGHGVARRTSISESIYSEANDRKSHMVLSLLQAQSVTIVQLISPCHAAFVPEDSGFKGSELF